MIRSKLWHQPRLQGHLQLPPTSLSLMREPRATGVMGRYRKKTLTFFNKFAHGLVTKQRPTVVPLSESLRSPAPQTSLSTNPRISSLDRTLICSIPFLQSSSSQTNLSFLFSLTSPQSRDSLVTMHDSALSMIWRSTITIKNGWNFYGR